MDDFARWLGENKLSAYQQALSDEGYDDLVSFSMIAQDEIDELADAVKMKPGHRKKMGILIQQAKEDAQRQMALKQREKEVKDGSKEEHKRHGEQDFLWVALHKLRTARG